MAGANFYGDELNFTPPSSGAQYAGFERETWVGGTTAATAAMLNRIENGIVAIDTCAGSVPASPTRVVNTTYRNETGKTIMVMVTVNGAAFPTETFRVNYWPPNQTVFTPYNRIRILSHNTST